MRFAQLLVLTTSLAVSSASAAGLGLLGGPGGSKGLILVEEDSAKRAPSGQPAAGRAASPRELGVRAAVIGVSEFKQLGASASLPWAAADASQVTRTLHGALRVDPMLPLIGEDATYRRARADLRRVLLEAGPDDVAYVYIATHGVLADGEAFLLLADSAPGATLSQTALSVTELQSWVRSSPAREVHLFVDPVHHDIGALMGVGVAGGARVAPWVSSIGVEQRDVVALTNTAPSVGAPIEATDCPGMSAWGCAVTRSFQGYADLNHDGLVDPAERNQSLPAMADQLSSRQGDVEVSGGAHAASLPVSAVPTERPFDISGLVHHEIEVCVYLDGAPVSMSHVFRTNDVVNLRVTVPETGQLNVVNVASDGDVNSLYPLRSDEDRVLAGSSVWVLPPDHPQQLQFRGASGREDVVVIWSRDPLGGPTEARVLATQWIGANAPERQALARSKGIVVVDAAPAGGATPGDPQGPCQLFTPSGDEQGWILAFGLQYRAG